MFYLACLVPVTEELKKLQETAESFEDIDALSNFAENHIPFYEYALKHKKFDLLFSVSDETDELDYPDRHIDVQFFRTGDVQQFMLETKGLEKDIWDKEVWPVIFEKMNYDNIQVGDLLIVEIHESFFDLLGLSY